MTLQPLKRNPEAMRRAANEVHAGLLAQGIRSEYDEVDATVHIPLNQFNNHAVLGKASKNPETQLALFKHEVAARVHAAASDAMRKHAGSIYPHLEMGHDSIRQLDENGTLKFQFDHNKKTEAFAGLFPKP